MDIRQSAIILPALEVTVHGTPGWQVLWNVAPLTTGTKHIHDAVHDLPDINLALAPTMFGRWDQMFNMRPLLIRQVARVAEFVPVVPGAVLWSPHAAPRESVAAIESREFRPHKPPSLTNSNDSHSSGTGTQKHSL
jgi:hypothetical protein